ncbi:MAG TPA: tRNA glutamyl-Q(34) synthetase GluQRS [Rhodanobacteraceae bacterium]|nr:tRNA glutamyl-Q(34) synthetase GluQRS [Rhodanobacteraceae bacterium]
MNRCASIVSVPSPQPLSRGERGSTYRGRFAPSPTGELHFGSLVAALASWLRAQQQGGAWLLRVEDIDPPREVPGSSESILAALDQLGLRADAPPLYQSRRSDVYASALERLRDHGHAFPCWCSRADLEIAGVAHRDGRCISPPQDDRPPAWRLHAPDLDVAFEDGLQGPQRQNVRDGVGDFVLKRADGLWSYQLACVVDDAFQQITEVVRGGDLLDSTPRQILLQCLLDLPTPAYLHLPLAVDAGGGKLSKSSDAPPVDAHDPRPALARALRFLGQPVPETRDIIEMLHLAAKRFELAPLRGVARRQA